MGALETGVVIHFFKVYDPLLRLPASWPYIYIELLYIDDYSEEADGYYRSDIEI